MVDDIIGSKYGRLTILSYGEPIIKPYRKNGYKTVVCQCECGNTKTILLNDIRKSKRHTRSCGCIAKETASIRMSKMNENIFGENNPQWKGGVTKLNATIRTSSKNIEWKKEVMKRDGYRCRLTGLKGEIEIHHIKSLSSIIKEYNLLKEDYIKFDLLFDINNGITLHKTVHAEFHEIYGDDVGLEEIIEFAKIFYGVDLF